MDDKPKVVQRTSGNIADLVRSFKFEPQLSAAVLTEERVFSHAMGYFLPNSEIYQKLIKSLQNKHPTVAVQTIEKCCSQIIHLLLDKIVENHNQGWNKTFVLGESTCELIDPEQLFSTVATLDQNLAKLVRDYIVFVPVTGIELLMPEYDLGPVKLVRTIDSLPALQKGTDSAEFQYVHPEIYKHFEYVPCIVQMRITGDTEFVRQEGVRQSSQLAAILNLHAAIWRISDDSRQKIQSIGVPSSYTTVVLVQTELPDEGGVTKPTYLPSVNNRGFMKQKLDQTQLNAVKQLGFDMIWRCFEQGSKKPKSIEERIRRSVMWFDKAVNFDEPDAQFVGLANALEILLVSESTISNPFSSWSGIAQQLADRCAYLLGYDLESKLTIVKRAKNLYSIRSGIVHGGKEPTATDLTEMVQLASRVILDFAQKGFSSFEDFEEWIKRLQYSVNLNEIDRYLRNKG